jgi:ubiquinone/menaquinone biosynthesis C-methylase UbiE
VADPTYQQGKDEHILQSWQRLYDTQYNKHLEAASLGSDFTGWNSFITGQAIPLQQMQAWRAELVGLIESLNPRRVLEVGVGSGLLMYPLLEKVERFVGLDLSKAVIERHQQYVGQRT